MVQSDILPISQTQRTGITLTGTVQGVGFRPFVYGLAKANGLVGFVRNLGGKLQIEVQGPKDNVNQFITELVDHAPPLASIKQVKQQILLAANSDNDFKILESIPDTDHWQSVPPDSATCNECLFELFDKNDRRFHYPFINCVNCGPRFTVINDLPYDRPYTSMATFPMCHQCATEYSNPLSRRFHAQPNACANCGPTLSFVGAGEKSLINCEVPDIALQSSLTALQKGKIVAIKGLGGFQLACDATNENAVELLRTRKARPGKPFALMMLDLAMIQKYCSVSEEEKNLLRSRRAPIVLLKALARTSIAKNIASGNYLLGVMLPCTPLHHLLSIGFGKPLVMTSANISSEPIVIDNQVAMQELSDIADYFLLHNRDIAARFDDSVTRVNLDKPVILRRSRGYAPEPIDLGYHSTKTILSFGAELKNTFCFVKGGQAFISPHIGDLNNIKTVNHFEETLAKYRHLFKLKEEVVACDAHPDYISSRIAERVADKERLPLINVQHHHAHIASCMVEHRLKGPVIGVALDGTGYGPDDTIWGGEFLIAQVDHFQRFACLEPVRMPGGEHAIREPWRMALGHIFSDVTRDPDVFQAYLDNLRLHIGSQALDLVCQQIRQRFNSPLTSSCGRLFDAVSSILGICHHSTYEGQAAIQLETVAIEEERERRQPRDIYPYKIVTNGMLPTGDPAFYPAPTLLSNTTPHQFLANYHVSTSAMLSQIAQDNRKGVRISFIARKFHKTLAQIITDLCCRIRTNTSISTVCLSGGVWQNYLLCQDTVKLLQSKDFSVFYPEQVPANDGGISLGQSIIAAAQTGNLAW